jgi:hypothetical protein
VGVAAFVHYGVTVGDGAVIDADAFLMKGEEVEPAARWVGNPAREVPEAPELPSSSEVRPTVAPLVLAGLVAVMLPVGVLMGVRGTTTLPFIQAAATAPAPAAPVDDAEDDAAADPTDDTADDTADDADSDEADSDEADDAADSVAPTAAVTPAVTRPAAAGATAAKTSATTTTKTRSSTGR